MTPPSLVEVKKLKLPNVEVGSIKPFLQGQFPAIVVYQYGLSPGRAGQWSAFVKDCAKISTRLKYFRVKTPNTMPGVTTKPTKKTVFYAFDELGKLLNGGNTAKHYVVLDTDVFNTALDVFMKAVDLTNGKH